MHELILVYVVYVANDYYHHAKLIRMTKMFSCPYEANPRGDKVCMLTHTHTVHTKKTEED